MIGSTFSILLPLFITIAGGWLIARFFGLAEEPLSRALTDFFMPLLVFESLYDSGLSLGDTAELLGAATFMVAAALLLALLYSRISGVDPRGFAMPVIFMNSGFLGIPLMQLALGTEAMNIIIVLDQLLTIYIFTLGFIIVGGGVSARGLLHTAASPILWAVVLGFLFRFAGVPVPQQVLETCRFAGRAAPPLAAFVVGCSLAAGRVRPDLHVGAGILLRMAGGFGIALAAAEIFGLSGLSRTVVLVTGALPAAVFSYVLPARFGAESEHAKQIVVLSTFISIFTIPLSISLAQLL
jgi:hypothetical protein